MTSRRHGGRIHQRYDRGKREARHCHPLDEGPAVHGRSAVRAAEILIAHFAPFQDPGK
jgi:hypothetical protein